MTEEGEFKDRLVKIIQEQREKIEKLAILGSWWSNIHIIGISEKETEIDSENIFEEIMAENLANLVKDIYV